MVAQPIRKILVAYAKAEAVMNDCSHWWEIQSAQGGVPSEGTCKLCGATKLFTNSIKPNVNPHGGDSRVVHKAIKENSERLAHAKDLV